MINSRHRLAGGPPDSVNMRRLGFLALMAMGVGLVFSLPYFLCGYRASPPGTKADRIVVIKSQKRLFLLEKEKIMGYCPVALGFKPGRKTTQGDRKTPEGRYENCRLKESSAYYKAIVITYPNSWERQQGYTGGAIEIHGLRRLPLNLEHYLGAWIVWVGHTDGCIMVSNRHIDEIIAAVKFPVTVEIRP